MNSIPLFQMNHVAFDPYGVTRQAHEAAFGKYRI